MRFLVSFSAMLLAAQANAGQLNVALGASVPVDPSNQTLTMKKGPSRANGGEHIVLKFSAPKTVSDIKITGFSTGKAGKAVIHSATAINGTAKTSLDGLAVFAKASTAGSPINYKNQVQLGDGNYVDVQPNAKFTQLDIVVEGFSNDDASILLNVTTAEGLPTEEFMVTRSSSSETLGGLINEANYAKFVQSDLASLMARAGVPNPADVAAKTYSCTSYSKLNPTQLNFKKRAYYMAGSTLASDSDVEGLGLTWAPTPAGLQMTIANFNGCGRYNSYNVVRITGGGNLISEVVVDLNAYVNLCAGANYDPNAVRDVETNSTFPSVLGAQWVVDSYEFCRPQ